MIIYDRRFYEKVMDLYFSKAIFAAIAVVAGTTLMYEIVVVMIALEDPEQRISRDAPRDLGIYFGVMILGGLVSRNLPLNWPSNKDDSKSQK